MKKKPWILLFDVMNTLVYDPIDEEIPDFFGVTLEELYKRKHPRAWQQFECGEIDESTFYDIYLPDRSESIDRSELEEVLYEAYHWIPGMHSLLVNLQQADVQLYAFSNYPVWYRIIERKLMLSRYLSWTFVSCKTGYRKPDEQAYRQVIDTLNVSPASCLFIDDRPENCRAARRVGMNALVFEEAAKLRKQLHERGFLEDQSSSAR